MSGAMTAVALAVSVATTLYTQNKQEQAQEDAMARQEELAAEAKAQEKAIRDNSFELEGATATFGTEEEDEEMGSYNEFLTTKTNAPKTGLGTSGSTGLGFGV